MAWRVFAAAAIGHSHIEGGIPCQDAYAHALVGDMLVAAVCDGAGSQALSDIGAAFVSAGVVDALASRADADALTGLEPESFRALVAEVVGATRDRLATQALAEGKALSEYSSTLVGIVADARGGYFFHIGDGLGVARAAADHADHVVSLPENGEYANETYFVTGDAWHEHLRVTAIPPGADTIALMSDGAMPFAMAKGNDALYAPFMDPVERYLSGASEADGSAALHGTLADPRTYQITSDDKTLLIALRR